MNLAILTGNLGRDPELKQVKDQQVLSFSIGVATGTKDSPETMWVDCEYWGKGGAAVAPYLAKGQRTTVSGSIKLRSYTAKDGTFKTGLKLNVKDLDLPPRGEPKPQSEHHAAKSNGYQPQPAEDFSDSIPF